jgi:hypothetical protein
MMIKGCALACLLWAVNDVVSYAQSTPVQPALPPYPRVVGYFSVVHLLVTVDKNEVISNFSPAYTVGFPTGLNILKSDRIGFSFEITPFIRAENGNSRVSNVLFHPGVMFRFPRYFTINARLAFETSGRYGFTPVLSQVVKRNKNTSYFVAVPLPVRLGSDRPASVGAGLQIGIGF